MINRADEPPAARACATPRRGAVLAAKALVVGVLTFAVATVAGALTLPIGRALLSADGNFVVPTSTWTDVRVVVGTAVVLALTAVFALAVGTIGGRCTPNGPSSGHSRARGGCWRRRCSA